MTIQLMLLPDSNEVVFDHLISSSLAKGTIATRISKRTVADLREAGLDIEKKLLPAYPRVVWEKSIEVCAKDLYPNKPMDEGLRQLAIDVIDAWRVSFVGKALSPMIRLLGPKRTILRSQQNFRAGNNYTVTKYKENGPTDYELWMNEPGTSKHFMAGILYVGLREAGANPVVSIIETNSLGTTYRLVW